MALYKIEVWNRTETNVEATFSISGIFAVEYCNYGIWMWNLALNSKMALELIKAAACKVRQLLHTYAETNFRAVTVKMTLPKKW